MPPNFLSYSVTSTPVGRYDKSEYNKVESLIVKFSAADAPTHLKAPGIAIKPPADRDPNLQRTLSVRDRGARPQGDGRRWVVSCDDAPVADIDSPLEGAPTWRHSDLSGRTATLFAQREAHRDACLALATSEFGGRRNAGTRGLLHRRQVAGARVATLSAVVVNPFTEEPFGRATVATAVDVDKAVRSAQAAFERGEWRNASLEERISVMEADARPNRRADR